MAPQFNIQNRLIGTLQPYERNARTHSRKQIRQIAASIARFGFTNPVLVTEDDKILAGHGRVMAAKLLGFATVPVLAIADLSDADRRAYILADNKLAANAGWDSEILAIELQALTDLEFDMDLTGFAIAEIDFALDGARDRDPGRGEPLPEDEIIPVSARAVSEAGDLWKLGRHVLACGDARESAVYEAVTSGALVDLIFTDPPFNQKINGHVRGKGKVEFREFCVASGELSDSEFKNFLNRTLTTAAATCRDGAIAFICMDWRGMGALLSAGHEAFTELKQMCVWNKSRGGMGTFYRSKYELVFVFKKGTAPHTNTFGLGETGRYRTNVWDYSNIPSSRADASDHPTPKPVAMVADAIKDCTKRGDLVLDNFGGSGTTMIAAEITGRSARLIELVPLYCDCIIRRFEKFTGKKAILAATGATFEEIEETRSSVGAEKVK